MIACVDEWLIGELMVLDFGFLKAKDIRLMLLQPGQIAVCRMRTEFALKVASFIALHILLIRRDPK